MLTLHGDTLHFAFPEVHKKARCGVEFQSVLRVPDHDFYSWIPPSRGKSPVRLVDDYLERLPEDWARHGGVFLPMYQSEALGLYFLEPYPCAIKVGAGKINAITGDPWTHELRPGRQDYLVTSRDVALYGFNVANELVRQFVAMPLGDGYTAEEQVTGLAENGGLQIQVYPMKVEAFRDLYGARADSDAEDWYEVPHVNFMRLGPPKGQQPDMGLAPGGLVRQPTPKDEYGYDVWDQTQRQRCFVHILNSHQYRAVTGEKLPYPPPGVRDYKIRRLPWYHHYSEGQTVEGSRILAKLASVATWFKAKHGQPLPDNDPPGPVEIQPVRTRQIRSG